MAVLLSLGLLASAAGGCGGGWREFSPPGGGFAVKMPGEPSPRPRSLSTPAGPRLVQFWTVQTAFGVEFGAGYADHGSAPFHGPAADALLSDFVRVFTVRNPGVRVRRRILGDVPGRRVWFPAVEGFERQALFHLDGGRLFLLEAGGPEGKLSEAGVDRFFDSFRILQAAGGS